MTHANFPDALVPPHPPAHALLDKHILSYASITPTDRQRLVQGSSTRCGFWWETRNLRGPPKRKPPPSIARSPAWENPKSQQYPQATTSPNNVHRPPPYRLPPPGRPAPPEPPLPPAAGAHARATTCTLGVPRKPPQLSAGRLRPVYRRAAFLSASPVDTQIAPPHM